MTLDKLKEKAFHALWSLKNKQISEIIHIPSE